MVVNPARGQLNSENYYFFLSPFAPENLVSRNGFDRPVQGYPARSLHPGCIWCLLTGFSRPSRFTQCNGIHLYRQPPSSQSRVYRVMQLRTDGVHRRELARTGPVVLNVVGETGAAFSDFPMDPINMRPSFPTPIFGKVDVCDTFSNPSIYNMEESERIQTFRASKPIYSSILAPDQLRRQKSAYSPWYLKSTCYPTFSKSPESLQCYKAPFEELFCIPSRFENISDVLEIFGEKKICERTEPSRLV